MLSQNIDVQQHVVRKYLDRQLVLESKLECVLWGLLSQMVVENVVVCFMHFPITHCWRDMSRYTILDVLRRPRTTNNK